MTARIHRMDFWSEEQGWLTRHQEIALWLGAASVILAVAGLALALWLATHLPADYLLQLSEPSSGKRVPNRHWLAHVFRNVLGALLLAVGALLLLLPGP